MAGAPETNAAGRRISEVEAEEAAARTTVVRASMVAPVDPNLAATVSKLEQEMSRLSVGMDTLLKRLPENAPQPAPPAPLAARPQRQQSIDERLNASSRGASSKGLRMGNRGSCVGMFFGGKSSAGRDPMSC